MAKPKLNGNDLAYIAAHIENFIFEWKTQIYFCFDSKDSGEQAFDILKRVYKNECNYSRYGIDKRDFYLGFTSSTIRNNVFNEIRQAINEYKTVNPEDIDYVPESELPENNLFKNDDNGGATKSGATTYIIIGAAAIILVLLLWNTKKK